MKKGILWLCRILVGGLFIFSGLIKANDPVGFAIKLEEYFELFAEAGSMFAFFKSTWLLEATVPLAAFICVLEVALGINLIIGLWSNLTAWLLLLMMLFFTWLTGYSAITGKVTDCGCFGDAIPLTPWQSFYKDIVLTLLILVIFSMRQLIKPIFGNVFGFAIFFAATAFSTWVCVHVLQHDVFKDFRPYAVGNNIKELMFIPEDADKPVVEMIYQYKNKTTLDIKQFIVISGVQENLIAEMQQVEIGSPEYIKLKTQLDLAMQERKDAMSDLSMYSSDKNWEFVSRNDQEKEKGFIPKIIDFKIIDDIENDITDDVLSFDDYIFMVVSHDLDKTDLEGWIKINNVQKEAEADGIFTFAFVSEGKEKMESFRHETQTAFPFYSGDFKVCLTIMRTNPGILLLKNGTIIDKWTGRDLPSFQEIKSTYFNERQKSEMVFGKKEPTEMFAEGIDVVNKISNLIEPYQEFFIVDSESNDFTQKLLNDTLPVYMMIVNDMTKVTQESYAALLPIMKQLNKQNAKWFVVSKSDLKLVEQMRAATQLQFMYYNSDGDVLQKIMEENTGIIVLKNGIVIHKYREGALPDLSDMIIQ